jgi:hypothetical protein
MEQIVKAAIPSVRLARPLMIVLSAIQGFICIGIIRLVLLAQHLSLNQTLQELIDVIHHVSGMNIYTGMVHATL